MLWYDSSGRIYLQMTLAQASSASHQGRCDNDVDDLCNHPKIKRQLNKLDPQIVADCLKDCGAWDKEELENHQQNLRRLVWIAAGDIVEKYCWR